MNTKNNNATIIGYFESKGKVEEKKGKNEYREDNQDASPRICETTKNSRYH